jgi:hypothetical protein
MRKVISTLFMAAVAVLGSLVLSPITHADNSSYMNCIRLNEQHMSNLPAQAKSLNYIQLGHQIEVDVQQNNVPPQQEINQLVNSGIDSQLAHVIAQCAFGNSPVGTEGSVESHGPGPYPPGPAPNAPLGPFAPGN